MERCSLFVGASGQISRASGAETDVTQACIQWIMEKKHLFSFSISVRKCYVKQ